MPEIDQQLILEATAWLDALNAITPPDETRPIVTYFILTGPGPTPAYALLRCKGPESVIEVSLGLHLTLQEAIDAMQRAAGHVAAEGWRFRLMCRECN